MGKQSAPSPEELEFIFRCFLRGLDNAEVIHEMGDTELPRRDTRSIRQRRREFDAAKKVLGEAQESESRREVLLDIMTTRCQEHWDDLVKVANQILSFHERWWQHSVKRDIYIIDDGEWELIDHSLATGLLCHLKAESPDEFQTITQWRELLMQDRLPREAFSRLLTVARRRTFAGTCQICESWTPENL